MVGVTIRGEGEHFSIDVGTTAPGVLQFLENERRCAFAHDKAITQLIERTRSKVWVVRSTHRLNNVERSDRDAGQRRLSASGDNDIGEIVANVAERFAD